MRAKRRVWSWAENRFRVLFDLIRRLEVLLKNKEIVVFAFFRRIFAADLRAFLVNAASIIRAEFFTNVMDEEIPCPLLHKDGRALVIEVPPDKIELFIVRRRVDRQRKISTTLARAVSAKFLGGNF